MGAAEKEKHIQQFVYFVNKGLKNTGSGYSFTVNSSGEYTLQTTLRFYFDNVDDPLKTKIKRNIIEKLKAYWNLPFSYSGFDGADEYPPKQLKIYFSGDAMPAGSSFVQIGDDISYNPLNDNPTYTLGSMELLVYCIDTYNEMGISRAFGLPNKMAFFVCDPTTGEEIKNGLDGKEFTVAHEFAHIFGLVDRYNYVQFFNDSQHKILDDPDLTLSYPMWLPKSTDAVYFLDIPGNLMAGDNTSILGGFNSQNRPMLTPMQLDIVLDGGRNETAYDQYTFYFGQECADKRTPEYLYFPNLKYIGIDKEDKTELPNVITNINVEIEHKSEFSVNFSNTNPFNVDYKKDYSVNKDIIGAYLSTIGDPSDAENFYNDRVHKKFVHIIGFFNSIKRNPINTVEDPDALKSRFKNGSRKEHGDGTFHLRDKMWNLHPDTNRTQALNPYLIIPTIIGTGK